MNMVGRVVMGEPLLEWRTPPTGSPGALKLCVPGPRRVAQ